MVKVSRGRSLLQNCLDLRKMSQAEFSRRSGWSVRMISYYCTGERRMSPEAMFAASSILEVPMESLYEWTLETEE
ncbi:helix-turn-helix protein [compost metagenome]